MRTLSISILLLTFGLFSAFIYKNNDEVGINFHQGSWEEALALAKKENKPIFLDLYASWCSPCKKMKAKTFSNEKVGTYFNKSFINVMIDAEKGEGKTLAKQFKVGEYPTLIFVSPNGEVIERTVGFYNVKDLCKWGEAVAKKSK